MADRSHKDPKYPAYAFPIPSVSALIQFLNALRVTAAWGRWEVALGL